MTPFNPGPPLASPPSPPSPPKGSNTVLWFFALLGVGAIVVGGGGVAWLISREIAQEKAPSEARRDPALGSNSRAKLPPIERQVPKHALALLDGCSSADLDALRSGIDGAIEIGAPLYNAGNFAGCYHMYEGTAADLERNVGDACAGPRGALEAGRTRAASQSGPSAQAWAMRDAFDGLLDVIERRSPSR